MNEGTKAYIRQHREDDVRQLALQARPKDVDLGLALEQISGWQSARKKLPSWAAVEGILYPPHLSMEQCSSEQTARYKAQLARSITCSHRTLVDLTGGLGVDFAFMAPTFERTIYVERQPLLCQLARHNLPFLGVQAEVIEADGTDYLHSMEPVSMIFLDPARRDGHGGRTYGISDCTPNVLELRDKLLRKAEVVMLKLSPMLDWRKAVSDLGKEYVREVHIVSVGGECKELLVVMQHGDVRKPLRIVCVNDDESWVPQPLEHDAYPSGIPQLEAGTYLYEPNASVMKAGCFESLCAEFCVSHLAPNSHLFVSPHFIENFPGRKFIVSAVSTFNKHDLKPLLEGLTHANITTRNFPQSVDELRKRLKLKEGGSTYLFATTLVSGEKVLLFTRKPYTH